MVKLVENWKLCSFISSTQKHLRFESIEALIQNKTGEVSSCFFTVRRYYLNTKRIDIHYMHTEFEVCMWFWYPCANSVQILECDNSDSFSIVNKGGTIRISVVWAVPSSDGGRLKNYKNLLSPQSLFFVLTRIFKSRFAASSLDSRLKFVVLPKRQ